MNTFLEALRAGKTTTAEALAIFDSLEPVGLDFMQGKWKGDGFPTGHPLDGALEAYHWRGKIFENPEQVHPLIFQSIRGGTLAIDPIYMLPAMGLVERLPFLKSKRMGNIFQLCLGLFATRRSRARLRLTHYRDKLSATMIYDSLPVNDVFRQVDPATVLGVMDMKGAVRPLFFVLRRE